MKTKLVEINRLMPEPEKIQKAADLITKGEVVSFPTETVYGLGADAMNPKAIQKIFKAKDRPADNPLIVHISDLSQLKLVATRIPKEARIFMKKFWPGPLSIVLPKSKNLPSETTAGLDTVVVRFPKHKVAELLITTAGTPIAAPSANLSGKVSPTEASHVLADLNSRIPMILDAGTIEYGLESTVIDCTTTKPTLLRPGSITLKELQSVVKTTIKSTDETTKSPGMKYKHYAPEAPIILFVGNDINTEKAIKKYLTSNTKKVSVLWHSGDFSNQEFNIQLEKNPLEAAPLLFSAMRNLDQPGIEVIVIQGFEDDGIGTAIMNRLEKAATEIIDV